jgi:transcription antitermination factor NusG
MPILPAEPALFPDELFAEAAAADVSGRRWWVLHTRPQQEKSLARDLLAREISFYLPQNRRTLLIRGRPMTSHTPLFPGYLFLMADREERVVALSTRRVVRSLEVSDQGRLWDNLSRLNRLIGSGLAVAAESGLEPGAPVVIRSGPLAGLRGRILKAAGKRRFMVEVDFIQAGASILMDDWVLDPAADGREP